MASVLAAPFQTLEATIDLALAGCETLIDVGCGASSPLRGVKAGSHRVGVDAHADSLQRSATNRIHHSYVQADVRKLRDHFKPKSFDAVVALDVIEHLEKNEGWELLAAIESIARRKVIVFTPNGFLAQGADDNPWQVHLSGWTVEEFTSRGYQVWGMHGWKPLRKEYAAIRGRPKFFWNFFSSLTQSLVRAHPSHAFQLFCIKDLTT